MLGMDEETIRKLKLWIQRSPSNIALAPCAQHHPRGGGSGLLPYLQPAPGERHRPHALAKKGDGCPAQPSTQGDYDGGVSRVKERIREGASERVLLRRRELLRVCRFSFNEFSCMMKERIKTREGMKRILLFNEPWHLFTLISNFTTSFTPT